jgi:hypothetical protein
MRRGDDAAVFGQMIAGMLKIHAARCALYVRRDRSLLASTVNELPTAPRACHDLYQRFFADIGRAADIGTCARDSSR